MTFIRIILLVMVIEMVNGYNIDADLARGLIFNDSLLIQIKSNDYMHLSDYPEDCAAVYLSAIASQQYTTTGVYEIWPRQGKPMKVWCDMDTDGGGWTVFQKRGDLTPQEDFYRTWLEYKRGFGDLQQQFWLGNDRLSMLTNQDVYQLRVDMEDFDGQKRFAQYHSFRVSNEQDKYRLSLGAYTKGDAGDSLTVHNGMKFSTKDQDNDPDYYSCAQVYNGAWWYNVCHNSNLNGRYLRGAHPTIYATGVIWKTFRGDYYSLKTTEMKIRPVWFKP
ncbi:unnamed protein product [Adineta steineri]|uniref:Fibrinogen C-terminal domain-containing protein n=1 Tax=Adineta steineri TaxID=433720 RepID=A0A819ATY0_9BILA|nr:unnamed protein product [Adineta steineri]CAF3790137.1 unnamed protein product [Adineta steineri]